MKMVNWIKNRRPSKHSIFVTSCSLIALCVISMLLFGFVTTKDVTIIDGNKQKVVTSSRLYVDELLAEQKIALNTGDKISVPLHSMLRHNSTIVIERGKMIQLTADGKTRTIYSCAETVADVLNEYNITLDHDDEIEPYLETPVSNGMSIQVFRVEVIQETVKETVPRKEVIRYNHNKPTSHVATIQEGADGVNECTYEVTSREGVVYYRTLLSKTVISKPIDKIIEKGAKSDIDVPDALVGQKVKKFIDCSATAYSFNVGSVTASGRPAGYGVIAVDPKVIPLGTKLYIAAPDGSWTYGFAVAGDTGGAIKGNKIDLFYNTVQECYQFGRRTARVYILE